MNPWSTHLPVLKCLMENFRIKRVLEFGMGDFSTTVFLKHNPKILVSIEHNLNWLNKCKTNRKNHVCRFSTTQQVNRILETMDEKFDLVFVDGPSNSRVACIEAAFPKARFIVLHDRNDPAYMWNRTKVPKGWYEVVHKKWKKWHTSVLSNDKRVKMKLYNLLKDVG